MTQEQAIRTINEQICNPEISIEEIVDKFTECANEQLRQRLISEFTRMRKESIEV